jgi:L-fucose/D-arabinose isomerase
MARIALATASDGREFVHEEVGPFGLQVQDRLAGALRDRGHEVITGAGDLGSNTDAVRLGRELAAARPDLTLINYPVWAFPHFSLLFASQGSGPLALFSNIDPQYPGMVGMLAAGGGFDQIGRAHSRTWGDPGDQAVIDRLSQQAAAAEVVQRLRGSTFGRVGGRPMGMYTTVANTDQWMARFGIDIEDIDQYELVRRGSAVDPAVTKAARLWLEKHAAGVHYDGVKLTPELLERQISVYYAMRELIDEWKLDFCGIKGQPEMTNNWCTMDIAEAFLNDPYDWDGPKQPMICATESDMDGALTMRILTGLSGTPALFADVRHYEASLGVWDLCNSGQHATWFAARSDDPAPNMAKVHLYPEVLYFPAGGASVHHIAAPGEMTFARLTRQSGRYRMHLLRGEFEQFDRETTERLARQSTYEWPHAFARFTAGAEEFLTRFSANHIHAVPGDYTSELQVVCQFLDIDVDIIGTIQ